MFLPVLMTRDYGAWAFLVFALPNVIGAAAMGWVIPDGVSSRRLMNRHAGAMVLFSQVTVAYQCFFAGWMLPQLIGWWTLLVYPLITVILIVAVRRDREFSWISLATWVFSLSLGAMLASKGLLHAPAVGTKSQLEGAGLLAPVCLFGFLLCPYLDLTFHHALQRAHEWGGRFASRMAFTLGFVVVFGVMIVGTFYYARLIRNPTGAGRMIVGFHMMLQMCVTIVLHFVQAGVAAGNPKGMKGGPLVILGGLAVGVLFWFVAWYYPRETNPMDWQAGEYVYRAFIGFYGLVAPAYVLMRMLPARSVSVRTVAIVCACAAPLYAAGFYTYHPEFVALGVAGVLAVAVLCLRAAAGRRASDF